MPLDSRRVGRNCKPKDYDFPCKLSSHVDSNVAVGERLREKMKEEHRKDSEASENLEYP